jgi:chromosome segregation protein
MYLKSIEIQGFKSFAQKIHFQFHNGITAIVGPNGSGKSNVADAVRWVLGEQRVKQLRGANMQDIIFAGTEARKPLSYAYVAITLDNTDHQLATSFDEVTVARRIYRSGESEYLMNGAICRLKDVYELFYDTGIGKEGYSIIGQGQIDRILSGKPEERRELFDEAAGIVKFKRRKAAASQKLENEKQNLIRVKDILAEVEKQLGPLEKRSEVAKIYLKKREELKTLDVNIFLMENQQLKQQLTDVDAKYLLAQEELNETNSDYEATKQEYEQLETQLEALEAQIEEERLSVSDTGLLRGKIEGEINVLLEQIQSSKRAKEQLKERFDQLKAEKEKKKSEKAGILEEQTSMTLELADTTKLWGEAREHLAQIQGRIADLNETIEKDKNVIIGELNTRAAIRSKLGRLDNMTEQLQIRKAQLHAKLLQAKSDESAREESIKELEGEFARIGEALQELRQREEENQKKLVDFREILTKKDEGLREVQTKYHQDKSKLDALINLAERYEGYGGSIRKIMELKASTPGIIGVVADIIRVSEKYETAIETALGGNIQNIVTDNEETAKKLITFLKQGRHGRATFLPLTGLENPQGFQNEKVLHEEGVLGLAHELIEIAPQYQKVAKSLLGRILVVDHVDHAIKISKKYHYSIRMVTLEGELFVPGGAISGGAYRNNSNLLGRKREITALEAHTKEWKQEIDRCTKDIADTKALRNRLRVDIEALKADSQRKSIEQNTIRLNIGQARARLEEDAQGYQDLLREGKEIEEQFLLMNQDKETTQQELENSEVLEQTKNQDIQKLQKILEEERGAESTASAEAANWELKTERLRQTDSFHQTNLDRIAGELNRYDQELDTISDSLIKQEEEAEQKEAEIVGLRETVEASLASQTAEETKLKEDIAQKEELSIKQKQFFSSREEKAKRISILDKEVYRLNIQKEKMEETIESKINYMWNEYEITLSDAAVIRNPEYQDLGAMKKEVNSLKDQIRKLGDVNVNAIEDYRVLLERYTFMKTQHDDLIEAEKTLENIIQELDDAMRKQFIEKFAEIAKEFDKVFKELFGGGKAALELTEGEDILEAGIRVIAQPPGKKLQNMMQLSGGEKALAAISLLFAIQNLKPSPFCLLDEIEAALDESNVGRFAKYLHKLTKNTQFIVITHRRGTMEQADRLYGITMQEKGVSALVSVNLVEKELMT